MNNSATFQLYPLIASDEMICEYLFATLTSHLSWQPITFRDLDIIDLICCVEDYSRNMSVKSFQNNFRSSGPSLQM